MTVTRITKRFDALKAEGRSALVTFVTAGDPNLDVSREILLGLADSGADIIELGMPFSDPMADGPAIQAASLRALRSGANMKTTLGLVRDFRAKDNDTPIVLMGYFNPIYAYGVEAFIADAKEAGVDGLIVVDLPPEEENELARPAQAQGLDFIYLTTPTSDDKRLTRVLRHASGFIYYVSITGITGTRSADLDEVQASINRIRAASDLPIAIGFGIKTKSDVADMAAIADGAVVGSALVGVIEKSLDDKGAPKPGCAKAVLDLVAKLSQGVRPS